MAAAKTSFYETRDWRDMDSQTRGDILLKIADLIDKNRDELARIESMDMGKPLREALGHKPTEVISGAILGIAVSFLAF